MFSHVHRSVRASVVLHVLYLSKVKHKRTRKCTQFWILFVSALLFLHVALSPSRLFLHLLLSLVPLHSFRLLISISPSYHICSLFQSWAASKVSLCSVCLCVCHSENSLHSALDTSKYKQNTFRIHVCIDTVVYMRNISSTCTHSHTWACFDGPQRGCQSQNLSVTPLHLCFTHSAAPFNMAQHDMAHYSSAPHVMCQLNTEVFREHQTPLLELLTHHSNSWSVYSQTEMRTVGQHAELWHMDGCYCTIFFPSADKFHSAVTNPLLTDVFYSGLIMHGLQQTPTLDLTILWTQKRRRR